MQNESGSPSNLGHYPAIQLPNQLILSYSMLMKLLITLLLFASIINLCAQQNLPLDTSRSVIHWKGTKMLRTGKHEGDIFFSKGHFLVSQDRIVGGQFEVDMNSISITDMPSHETEAIANLTNHLKSDDFFSVAQHPYARFKINSISERGMVLGLLTIRGISHEIEFTAEIHHLSSGRWKVEGQISIDRQKWGVSFRGLKDMVVDDTIYLRFEVYSQ